MAQYRMVVTTPANVARSLLPELTLATVLLPNLVVWFIEYDGVSAYTVPSGCSIEVDSGDTALLAVAP